MWALAELGVDFDIQALGWDPRMIVQPLDGSCTSSTLQF